MTLPALLLAVTATIAEPCALPDDATWEDASYLYCSERRAAVLFEHRAEDRRARLDRCEGDRADRDRALAACHARLVEAPPPPPEAVSPVLVGVVAGGVGLAIGVLVGAFVL